MIERMKMKTKTISVLALALLITACSKDNDPINGGGDDTKSEIVLGTKVTTRASVESDDDGILTLPTSLEVAFLRAENAATANWASALAGDQAVEGTGPGRIYATLKATTEALGSNTITFDKIQYYHGNQNIKSFLKGYYPEDAVLTKATAAPEHVTATWTIDGTHDLMVSNYFSENKDKAGEAVPIVFNHLLSKITIKAIAESDAVVKRWGNIIGVKIKSQPTKITHIFNGSTENALAASVPENADITIRKVTNGQITDDPADALGLSTTSTSFGQAMVLPAGTYSIEVTTSLGGTPAPIEATITNGAQPGMNHEILLTFKTGEIVATTKVTAWKDSDDSGAIDVE